jgi:4'-phosphopantetheinyl transferase
MTIAVWRLDLDDVEDVAIDALSAEERVRAARFVHAPARLRFVAGRALARSVLAEHLGLGDPRAVELMIATGGRPRLRDDRLQFNLAHSAERVLLAVGSEPLGVDVERGDPGRVTDALARSCLTADECAEADAEAFFELWAAKEACMKATGDGLALGASTFAAPRPWGSPTPRPVMAPDGHRASGLGVCWLDAGAGYAAAVAAPGVHWDVTVTSIAPEAVGCR